MHPNHGEGNSHSDQGLNIPPQKIDFDKIPDADPDEEMERVANEAAERRVSETRARREAKAEVALSATDQIRRDNPDIVKRAKELFTAGFFEFKDVKYGRMGEVQVKLSDTNISCFLDVMFGDGDLPRPHFNEFVGRIVDHRGEIIDDHYPVLDWIEACRVAGLREMPLKKMRENLREWSLARRWNDLIERVEKMIPEWDGVTRMSEYLGKLFEPIDTDLNKKFSKYFWLSLYARVMMPGAFAPMVLSLFGVQNCGKSYFGKRLSQIITGDPEADSVQLDLGSDKTNFLREITGTSVVASVGEMTGFTRGDLNKIKDFVTRTTDKMHYKFEGHIEQPRQWVTIMDGNKYEGLQRDETGNRRFYPIFCGELQMEHGQRRWKDDFAKGPTIASEQFESDVWQLLAEAASWFDANGLDEYRKFVDEVSKDVRVFSADEMRRESGTIDDELVSPYIDQALMLCTIHQTKNSQGAVRFWIDKKEVEDRITKVAGRGRDPVNKPTSKQWGMSLKKAMMARGSGEKSYRPAKPINVPSYPFATTDKIKTVEDLKNSWCKRLGPSDDGDSTPAFELPPEQEPFYEE